MIFFASEKTYCEKYSAIHILLYDLREIWYDTKSCKMCVESILVEVEDVDALPVSNTIYISFKLRIAVSG